MKANGGRSFLLFYLLGLVLIVAVAAAVWTLWRGRQARESGEAEVRAAAAAAGPSVQVATAVRGPNVRRIALVGEALPYKSTTLYSKVSGYLTRISVDVGDRVKAGQFIAEIQSPEIDQQIATLHTSLENKRRVLQRTQDLAQKGFFSQQALDNAQTDVEVAESQLAELRTLSRYRALHAPFAGVVTARYADPGALVTNASSNQTSALPLATISDTSRLKVSVYVEQSEAPNVRPGLEVEIIDAASPQRRMKGTVTRVSGELDPRTRTLLTEVDFDNTRGELVAGSFVNVNLLVPAVSHIEVPAAALVSRDRKTLVAVVTPDKTVRLQPVELASTDGKVLRIAAGLNEGERVALSLPASVLDGAHVNPMPIPAAPAPAAAPATQPGAPPAPPPVAAPPLRRAPAGRPEAKAAAGATQPLPPAAPGQADMGPAAPSPPSRQDAAPALREPPAKLPAPAPPAAPDPAGQPRKPLPGEV